MKLSDLTLHPRTMSLAGKLSGKLPHALIIDGPVGSGVLTVAKALAGSVDSPIMIINPKKKLKGEVVVDPDEGSVIIEDIRSLYEQTRTKQPGSCVYIIDTGAKTMTPGAQNAFLKLLEEPRSGVYFIIATHRYDQLLPTIISRSQRLSLLPITDEQTSQLVQDLGIADETKRTRLTFVGSGLPALVHRLAADERAYEDRVAIMRDAKILISGKPFEKLVTLNAYRDHRSDAVTLLDDMNHQLRIVLRSHPDKRLVREIERHLETRNRIAAGGNIRLQIMADVL